MKTKELLEIRKKSIDQLKKMIEDKKEDLRKINLDMTLGQESNVKKAKLLKTEIAQLMTITREKELLETVDKTEDETNEKGENK